MDQRKAVKVLISFEVREYSEGQQDFQDSYYDDYFNGDVQKDNESYELLLKLPESRDELVEILERWVDYIPDDFAQNEIEDGFRMVNFDDFADDYNEIAEFSARDPEEKNPMNTSIPQKIVIYFDDGTEEDVEISSQEETLNRVLDLIEQ